MCLCVFFFFKQKTAYEMRISDWSSDVCSSDLLANGRDRARQNLGRTAGGRCGAAGLVSRSSANGRSRSRERDDAGLRRAARCDAAAADRSEEHTSELQSLMRISYAVFCLKKKKKKPNSKKRTKRHKNVYQNTNQMNTREIMD